ncbi:MAG: MATE family efflux transporter, partial [Clostridia bacterium]|nr:MATE family efflux transporter [Clostridia bacterium]
MMFSRRELMKIVIPLIIQQILAVTVGMVDTMMVSAAGEAAVSGVSLVNSLDVLLVMAFTSLAAGGAVVVSQFLGQKNREATLSSAKQLLYASTGIAVLLTVIVLLLRVPLLNLLFGDVEPDVMQSAQGYFFFVALSFPLLAIENSCAALFRAMGNSMISMLASLGMNLVNVCGNALLIMHFGMGAAGAAIATLFARLCGAALLLVLIHNKKNEVYVERLFHYRPDFKIIKAILRIGVPNGIENSMFQFGKLLTQSLISSMGTAAIAANAVAHTLANFQYMPGTAFSNTMVTVVGRCIGAKEKEQAKYYARRLTAATYGCLWVVILLTFLFAKPIIGIYDLSAEGSELALRLILYHSVCAAVLWPTAFTLASSFRAASDVKFPLVVSMFSMWAFRVALSYVFATESVSVFGLFVIPGLGLGPIGVWIAMTVDWVFRAILFAIRHFSGKWLTKYR